MQIDYHLVQPQHQSMGLNNSNFSNKVTVDGATCCGLAISTVKLVFLDVVPSACNAASGVTSIAL